MCLVHVAENMQDFVVNVYTSLNPAWASKWDVVPSSTIIISIFFLRSHCGTVLETAFCLVMGMWKKRPGNTASRLFREGLFPLKTNTVVWWKGGRRLHIIHCPLWVWRKAEGSLMIPESLGSRHPGSGQQRPKPNHGCSFHPNSLIPAVHLGQSWAFGPSLCGPTGG